jgi:acyl carrier protein
LRPGGIFVVAEKIGAPRRYWCGEFNGFLLAHRGGTSVEAVFDQVRQIIAKELKIPSDPLTPDTRLQDLGAESLDVIEIIFALEEKFDISIPFNANDTPAAGTAAASTAGAGKLETIGQISAAVQGLIDAKAAA